jgi:deoxyadenosine/deoxycytidine kinase
MRLPHDIKFLAVEGVIGVGKSTLTQILQERLNARLFSEVFEQNPFLQKFYEDREAWAFQTQMFFLLSRHKQFQDTFRQHDLFYHLTISDYTMDKDRIFATQNLSEEELAMYDTVAAALERDMIRPDFIVYLQASVPNLLARINKRDRPMERNMDPSYLQDLVERYNHHYFHYNGCPVLIVNTDHIDFVENEKDLEALLKMIASAPAGTTFYSPISMP